MIKTPVVWIMYGQFWNLPSIRQTPPFVGDVPKTGGISWSSFLSPVCLMYACFKQPCFSARSKNSRTNHPSGNLNPEADGHPFTNGCFNWMIPIFWQKKWYLANSRCYSFSINFTPRNSNPVAQEKMILSHVFQVSH